MHDKILWFFSLLMQYMKVNSSLMIFFFRVSSIVLYTNFPRLRKMTVISLFVIYLHLVRYFWRNSSFIVLWSNCFNWEIYIFISIPFDFVQGRNVLTFFSAQYFIGAVDMKYYWWISLSNAKSASSKKIFLLFENI